MPPRSRRSVAPPVLSELESTWVAVSRVTQRKKNQEHVLVLQAVGIPCGSMLVQQPETALIGQPVLDGARESAGDAWLVLTRPQDAQRARHELERYERENIGWPPRELATRSVSQGLYAALIYATVMALVFIWDRNEQFGQSWLGSGRAVASRIAAGEWWRTITALSLHADLQHLLGNIVFGSVFGVILAQSIGVGPAWLTVLASGALGNLVNAWIQPATHASIGASTAVFGALGAQVAFEWMRRKERRSPKWKRWAPVIGGFALLGWLGAGGSLREVATMRENMRQIEQTLATVDVMAHVTGFVTGALIGIALALRRTRATHSTSWQAGWGSLALLVLALSWVVAFAKG